MAAASLVSAALAVAVVGRHMGAEVLLGIVVGMYELAKTVWHK